MTSYSSLYKKGKKKKGIIVMFSFIPLLLKPANSTDATLRIQPLNFPAACKRHFSQFINLSFLCSNLCLLDYQCPTILRVAYALIEKMLYCKLYVYRSKNTRYVCIKNRCISTNIKKKASLIAL